jgi:lipoprotein-releasing system permease protein
MPKKTAQEMMEYGTHITAIELSLEKDADPNVVKAEIQNIIGGKYTIKTKYEQNELMYKVNQSEKWFTFSMLVFVLILSTSWLR